MNPARKSTHMYIANSNESAIMQRFGARGSKKGNNILRNSSMGGLIRARRVEATRASRPDRFPAHGLESLLYDAGHSITYGRQRPFRGSYCSRGAWDNDYA